MATITGTSGDDRYPRELEGTALADQIFGLAGNDVLIGFGGNDTLEGGAGADELFGSDGLDLASYRGSPAGVSILLYNSSVSGGDAQGDTIFSVEGAVGSAFRDGMLGDEQRNVFRGEGGDDGLSGFGGDDRLEGGNGNDVLNGGAGNDELLGGAGTDTADFFSYGDAAVAADLASGTANGGVSGGNDRLSGIENLAGTDYDDRLAGNAGANRLDGAVGADVLTGRGGADRFFFESRYDSTPADADRVVDFSRAQGDRIDLAGVDANEQAAGEQAFRFVGQGPFTGAGQVRWFQQDGDTVVEANTTDAATGAELRIEIDPLVSLQAADFVL